MLELSIFETGQPFHFRLSGHLGDRVWLETRRTSGSKQRFEFVNRGAFWQSLDETSEPHDFSLTVPIAHSARVHLYKATFAEHDHDYGEDVPEIDDALYVPSPTSTTVLVKHSHMHRRGRSTVHTHLHDHEPDTWYRESTVEAADPRRTTTSTGDRCGRPCS